MAKKSVSKWGLPGLSTIQKAVLVLVVLAVIAFLVVKFMVKPGGIGGIIPPTAPKPKVVKYYQFYGQSLSVGRAGIPVKSTTQPNPENVFGPEGGPREEFKALVPLVEKEQGKKMGETPVAAMANGYFMNFVEDKDRTIVIANTAGVGGQTVKALTDEYFARFKNRASKAKQLADAKFPNNKFFMPAVFWIQGESDRNNTENGYINQFTTLAGMIQDVAKTLTGYNTSIISYQTAGSAGVGGVVQKAQLALHEEGILSIATPIYFLDFAGDETHLTARGSQVLGAYMARAAKYADKGERPPLLRPLAARKTGEAQINITFDIPTKPLQLLNANKKEAFRITDMGAGKNIGVKSVKIAPSGDEVIITTDTPITGDDVIVKYALHSNSKGSRSEGDLTDSSTDVVDLGPTGSPVKLLNYAPHFELKVE